MSKIRDLGITAIPERGPQAGLDGLFAACPQPSQCPGQSGCPNKSAQVPCECTETGCACTDGNTPPPPTEPRTFTHEAVAQLQYQLQQKMAHYGSLTV
jgi:hypothetical protein